MKRRLLMLSIVVFSLACGDDDDEPLAHIGETPVSDADFAAYAAFKRVRIETAEQAQEALDEYLRRGAISQAIEATGTLDAAAINAELEEFRREMLISRYFETFLRTAVTDEAIENYYNEHASEYEERKAHVAHILVRVNRRMTPEERRAARTKIQDAYSRLEAGGDFTAVATEMSEDRVSAPRGGDLGWVREGAIHPLFSERAFATEPNSYTPVFETPFGFHILRVMEAPQVIRRPIEAVRGDIRYQLRNNAKEAELTRLSASVETQIREGGYRRPASAAASDSADEAEDEPEADREPADRDPGSREPADREPAAREAADREPVELEPSEPAPARAFVGDQGTPRGNPIEAEENPSAMTPGQR